MQESELIENTELNLPDVIIPDFCDDHISLKERYNDLIKASIWRILPQDYAYCKTVNDKIEFIKRLIPSVVWDYDDSKLGTLSIKCIYKYRIYSSKFIYDIISRWLIPGKRLNILSTFGSDFSFKDRPNERFILVSILLNIETREDLETIKKTLPMVASEIQVGVVSIEQGMRILEIKGLNVDEKTNLVQDSIVSLMNQKSNHFDRELFTEMQRFFVYSSDYFKELREYRHLVRIICWQYLFRDSMSKDPESARLIRTKLMKTRLHYPYGAKTVLGVLVGISHTRENELFGESQITKAIQNCIPSAKLVNQSFIENKKVGDLGLMIYAEYEKPHSQSFTFEELSRLRTLLPQDLKSRIEQFMHPIFLPRNEEEIMRNILNLSKQLKRYGDIPQIIINFDSQSSRHITFTVLLLRVIRAEELSVQDICHKNDFKYEYLPDRIKIIGQIKKKFLKEANVFYVRLEKQDFLRKDHSLDLYKARQSVLDELFRIFTDVRDYNGGMIAKENELLDNLKNRLRSKGEFNELMLENFFYALSPSISRSMLEPKLLETFFLIFQEAFDQQFDLQKGYVLKFVYQSKYIFAYVKSQNMDFQKAVKKNIEGFKLTRLQLVFAFLNIQDAFYLGLVFHSERADERKRFCDDLRNTLEELNDDSSL